MEKMWWPYRLVCVGAALAVLLALGDPGGKLLPWAWTLAAMLLLAPLWYVIAILLHITSIAWHLRVWLARRAHCRSRARERQT
jgi:hypothetical protein